MNKSLKMILITICGGIVSILWDYNADDFWWGRSSLIKYWTSPEFGNYDGRYLGNSLTIIGFQNPLLQALIYGGTLAIIWFLISKITKSNSWATLAFITLVALPPVIFAQTLGWKAGFNNYVTSGIAPLILLRAAQRFILESEKPTIPYLLGLPIISFIFCFLSEPITILIVISNLAFTIINFTMHKKWSLLFISSSITSIIGATLMFINGGYHNVMKGSDQYRRISFAQTAFNIKKIIADSAQSFIWIITLLGIGMIVYCWQKKLISNTFAKILTIPFILYIIAGITQQFHTYQRLYLVLVSIPFILSIITIGFLYLKAFHNLSINERWVTCYLILGALALILPYLVVTPFGPRCLFGAGVLLALLGAIFFKLSGYEIAWLNRCDDLLLILWTCILFVMGSQIHQAKELNIKMLKYQMEYKTGFYTNKIYYVHIPLQEWWWSPHKQNHDTPLQVHYHAPENSIGIVVSGKKANIGHKMSDNERLKLMMKKP